MRMFLKEFVVCTTNHLQESMRQSRRVDSPNVGSTAQTKTIGTSNGSESHISSCSIDCR